MSENSKTVANLKGQLSKLSGIISKSFKKPKQKLIFNIYKRNWYYIFDKHSRFQILTDSLKHCQKHKGVKIYAYVFMINV
jgi:hypothetical protein